jgi:hypothetical protein
MSYDFLPPGRENFFCKIFNLKTFSGFQIYCPILHVFAIAKFFSTFHLLSVFFPLCMNTDSRHVVGKRRVRFQEECRENELHGKLVPKSNIKRLLTDSYLSTTSQSNAPLLDVQGIQFGLPNPDEWRILAAEQVNRATGKIHRNSFQIQFASSYDL